MCHNLFRLSQLERDHVSRDLCVLFPFSRTASITGTQACSRLKNLLRISPPLASVGTISTSQETLSRAAQAFPHFGPSNASFSPTYRATADHRTIHTAGCYRHVTTNVCTEPRIIRPTQPMRKSPSESAQSLNIDALIPAPNASPKPAQRLFTGGVPRSNPLPSRCANQRRNRPAIGPCRRSPAGMLLPQS